MKELIQNDLLPENPFYGICRYVISQNLLLDITDNFEQINNHYQKNKIEVFDKYGVYSLNFKELRVFGFKHILQLIDIK